jgi:hypothetical protein
LHLLDFLIGVDVDADITNQSPSIGKVSCTRLVKSRNQSSIGQIEMLSTQPVKLIAVDESTLRVNAPSAWVTLMGLGAAIHMSSLVGVMESSGFGPYPEWAVESWE